jgi:hypothetical protein
LFRDRDKNLNTTNKGKDMKTNLTQLQLDQLAKLISFNEDENGILTIQDVLGDVKGHVWGSVWGSVRGVKI